MPRVAIRGWSWVPRFVAYAITCALPMLVIGLFLNAAIQGERNRDRAQTAHLLRSDATGLDLNHFSRFRVEDAHETWRLLGMLERDVTIGLVFLYIALIVITGVVGARLRRDGARNAFLASHDRTTGLPNRMAFARATQDALDTARSTGCRASIALLDIDRFKAVNDTLGHTNGDLLLCELARRMSDQLGPGCVAARLGGDEFGIVHADGRDADATLRALRELLGREFSLSGLTVSPQVSIGYTIALDDGEDVETLLARADIALFETKARNLGVSHYEAAFDRHDAASLGLVAELRHAIDADQLVLHYQPQLEESSGRVKSLEALVRWQHPVHGLLSPDRFLPLAEQTDDIERLTSWVLRQALRDIVRIGEDGGDDEGPSVAVNVSARCLSTGGLAAEVLGALCDGDVAPRRLTIEVTETAILTDPDRAAAELEQLARAGVRISLDDFGRGQTSIGHFSALPLDELKIDRSFVGDMDHDATHAAIVRSLVQLGRNLGLQVVAEGVETERVRSRLRETGVDVVQGYLISRPLPLDEVRAWLRTHDPGPARNSDDAPSSLPPVRA